MVTLDVRFSCEVCKTWIIHQIRIGPHFFLGADNIPDGWVIRAEEYSMRAYCPLHTGEAK